ncbi:myosin-binding protein 1-like isoform X2 [Phragmites australis]|uniref:myosin-binding protein 1-like isoform X2 n=1 Tax=Phragmites australis TaxID=29695 RepID=UPI002D78B48D|nr:myosin-binding protein 1-like isoform X2 [Phragmites australis]
MGTRMPILRRVSSALSTALLEWILMLLLFIDAVYSFLVTRFARLCRLPAPCPFCSRLDHVLGNEKPCFYRELICKIHKSEISSLAFCRLHQKLAGAQSMCEECCEKANDDDKTDEPVMDAGVHDSNQGIDDVLNSPRKRICSCCGQHFKQRSVTLSSRKIAEPEPTEAFGSPKIYTDYSIADQLDESLEPKDIYHQSDPMSHERHSLLQMTSDSEVEVPCDDDGKSSHHHETNVIEKDLHEDAAFERPVLPSPVLVKESGINVQTELTVTDLCDTSLANPVADDNPDNRIDADQMEAKDSSSRRPASQHDPLVVIEESSLKDADISHSPVALSDNLEQVHGPEVTATSSGEIDEKSALVDDPGTTEPEPQDTHHVASEDADLKDNSRDIHVSQANADSAETIGEAEDYTKKIEPTGDLETHELTFQDPSNTASKDFIEKDYVDEAHISAVAAISSGEVPQDTSAVEKYPKTSETTGEMRPSLSTQISMNEAYRLAIGSKSSLPSPTLTDVILGKDSTSSVNEELRLLLSQLSASRGLEAPWVDPGPSPRAYGRGDELVVQNITKRISIERNASGLESLDMSIVSEMEGESTIDRLRRQIDLDRKSIHLLCRELEEERNASAIATSQALAMITKLQDEKAAMQMEASHYQRMMEEQAEYDSEALAKANELLAEREQQIEELEGELENYRRQFGGGPTETQANQAPIKEENTDTALLGEGDIEYPMITTPRGINSLVSFEEERAYIANCLRKLEQKLQSYSNNSTSVDLSISDVLEDDLCSKACVVEDDSLRRQESSRETEEHISLGKESGLSTISEEVDLTTVQEEIASLNGRLKTLEGDRNFLEHSINSLRNGNEGLMFIREIACNLRELRAVAIDKK